MSLYGAEDDEVEDKCRERVAIRRIECIVYIIIIIIIIMYDTT